MCVCVCVWVGVCVYVILRILTTKNLLKSPL